MTHRLFLIDGSSYFYRAFFAVRGLVNSKGMPTNAAFGFTSMLTKILKSKSPEAIAVVFDAPGKTFRDELYSEYKATRVAMPEDLARHSCVQYRVVVDGGVFKWPFERSGKSQRISVDGRIMVNDPDLAVRAAVDGLGIAYTVEALAEPFLRSGQLVRVLEDWSPFSDGLFLYYPGHRQVPVALRALIDMLHAARSAAVLSRVVRRVDLELLHRNLR